MTARPEIPRTRRAARPYAPAMVIGVVLFAVLGTGLTALRAVRRQWLAAIATLAGACCVETSYSGIALHQPWIDIVAAVIGVVGSAVLWWFMRRDARSAAGRQPG